MKGRLTHLYGLLNRNDLNGAKQHISQNLLAKMVYYRQLQVFIPDVMAWMLFLKKCWKPNRLQSK